MIIETFPVGLLQCNCTILGSEQTREAIVIDPGDEIEVVLARLKRHGLTAKYIIATHAHIDHVGGFKLLKEATAAPVYLHRSDLFLYEAMPMQARMLQGGSGAPVRNSAFGNAEALRSLTVPREWVDTVVASLGVARPGLPIIVPVTEFRDIVGIALTNMINGADAATELRKATAEFLPVLEKSERA